MKLLKEPIFYLQWILILLSIVALVLITIEGFKMSLQLSTIGFQNYLKLYSPYSILFTATFIVITAHLAIERLGLMTDANNTSYKISNKTLWIQTVKEFLVELKTNNPMMYKDFSRQLINIHDYLFDSKFVFSNYSETKKFFDKFFASKIQFFEEMNTKYMYCSCYINKEQSYSWDEFRYIIVVMINIEECYTAFISDLNKLHQIEVLKFSTNQIDPTAYKFGLTGYRKYLKDRGY